MEPILEQQRRYHEERERLMDAMVGESLHSGIIPGASSAASGKSAFSDVTLSHRDTVNSMHRKVGKCIYCACSLQSFQISLLGLFKVCNSALHHYVSADREI